MIQFQDMIHKQLLTLTIALLFSYANAQVSARLMRYPDVSDTHITFVYGNDIWVVPKSGGTANRLSSPDESEFFPRFSPDGKSIAFTANYEGNRDVYVIPSMGGIPKRLTYHGMSDYCLDWTNDGSAVLYRSSKESGKQRFSQFYTIATTGGSAQKLPVPYGEFASYNDDATEIAFTDQSRVNRTWKRYRGGSAADIHVFNLSTFETENITDHVANDEIPMWHGDNIYFISDRGSAKRYNIWKYNTESKETSQVTNFTDFDIHYPSIGPKDIVFQAGDQLYLLNLESEEYEAVDIKVVTDQTAQIPRKQNVSSYFQSATPSPDGKRVVVQARGELFSLPAEEGFTKNLTRSSGVAERHPSWSPDGKTLAYWSDQSGEYQLVLKDMKKGTTRNLTSFKNGFRYNIYWSPDSKKLAYVNQAMEMQYIDVNTGVVTTFNQGKYMFEGPLRGFRVSWSPDSRWIAYIGDKHIWTSNIMVYDTKNKTKYPLTSGFYADGEPEFSIDGKHLFFTTNRKLDPVYSDTDNTFIYPNTTQLAVATLEPSTESLLLTKNDAVKIDEDQKNGEESNKSDKKSKKDKEEDNGDDDPKPVNIEWKGFEDRVEIIEGVHGNLGRLRAVDGKLLFMHYPYSGAPDEEKSELKYWDIEKREFKTILNDLNGYDITDNRKKILVQQKKKLAVIDIAENAKIEKTVPMSEMMMSLVPQEEWQQIFNDVWRFERDYFYDSTMHGVDWGAMKERYGALVGQANSREDVNFIIGELIGELNASHTYRFGGDTERADRLNVGYLGADFNANNGYYQIARIIKGAPWDAEVRSPLLQSGVNAKKGEYILAINGEQVTSNKPISAWLQGLAKKPVELALSTTTNMTDARKVVVTPLSSETRLRNLAWINQNRKRVEEATDGEVGYVYVPSTGIDGQTELMRQFYAQLDKKGMIIDERFNNGGQIPDRFIEMLDRKPLAFWAVRDGKDWAWPPVAHFGPKVMLINGFSGSGGDAFPDYFRKAGLGPLIGTRTWGGLIGISGAPALIDNGIVTVPTFRMYDPDGTWFKEGHGVDPDIEVREDFKMLANGMDAQLEAAIEEVMKRMKAPAAFTPPERPARETR
jgi:tricorn protease